MCFCCGWCKFANNKDDDSKWGMFNRFCPWMPCAEPPPKQPEMDKSLLNPMTIEQQGKSLFGKKSALEAAEGGEAGKEKASGGSSTTPLTSGAPDFSAAADGTPGGDKKPMVMTTNPFSFRRPKSVLSSKSPMTEEVVPVDSAIVVGSGVGLEPPPPPPPPSSLPPPLSLVSPLATAAAAAAAKEPPVEVVAAFSSGKGEVGGGGVASDSGLSLPADPTSPLHATPQQQASALPDVGGGAAASEATTAAASSAALTTVVHKEIVEASAALTQEAQKDAPVVGSGSGSGGMGDGGVVPPQPVPQVAVNPLAELHNTPTTVAAEPTNVTQTLIVGEPAALEVALAPASPAPLVPVISATGESGTGPPPALLGEVSVTLEVNTHSSS